MKDHRRMHRDAYRPDYGIDAGVRFCSLSEFFTEIEMQAHHPLEG